MELLGQKAVPFLVFWGNSILFSTGAAPPCIPTNSALGFPFLHNLASSCCLLICLVLFILLFLNIFYYWNIDRGGGERESNSTAIFTGPRILTSFSCSILKWGWGVLSGYWLGEKLPKWSKALTPESVFYIISNGINYMPI